MKTVRDGSLQVAVATLVAFGGMKLGVPQEVALSLVAIGAYAAPFAYRIARRRWPWLMQTDPPGGAQ